MQTNFGKYIPIERFLDNYGKPNLIKIEKVIKEEIGNQSAHGNLAAATSTGGMTNKRPGRVGDSPLIGSGTYADNRSAAISCTGTGEMFIRAATAYDVCTA